MLKSTTQFISEYPYISRISIINDLNNPGQNDSSFNTLKGIIPVLQRIYGKRKTIHEIKEIALNIVSSIQGIFLRRTIIKEFMDIDFSDDKQRNWYIENLVNTLVRED
jgi:hypothetical protein